MRFRNDDFPAKQPGSHSSSELTDTIAEEHPKHFVAVAEEQIKAMHHHEDGSSVELHEVGSHEFISQSIASSLEGKLVGNSGPDDVQLSQLNNPNANSINAAKIEYEKKLSQNQPQQLYGEQQSVTGGVFHGQETAMVGCNCGLEWTVTGQSTKAQGAEGVKVEQYGSGGTAQPGGYRSSGAGGEKQEYRTLNSQQSDYKG